MEMIPDRRLKLPPYTKSGMVLGNSWKLEGGPGRKLWQLWPLEVLLSSKG